MRLMKRARCIGKLPAILLCIAAAVLFVSLNPLAETGDDETVRVGYYENEVFQEGAGQGIEKTGYAYEYYRKISEYTGWRYDYIYGDYGDLYEKLENGEIDLLAGLAFTDERAGVIGYPDLPMGSETFQLIKHDTD